MRLARLARAHPVLLRDLDDSLPWAEQEAQLRERFGYGANDALTAELTALGHPSIDVVVNHEAAQQAWAEAHGHDVERPDWQVEVLLDRLRRHEPDVLFVSDFKIVDPSVIDRLRRELAPLLVVAWSGAQFDDRRYFESADLVLTCVPELIPSFRQHGRPVELLAHAFDARLLAQLGPRRPDHDSVIFVGQLQRWHDRHMRRVEVLEHLVAAGVAIDVHAPQYDWDLQQAARSSARTLAWQADRVLGAVGVPQQTRRSWPVLRRLDNWEARPPSWRSRQLRAHLRPPLFGLEMFAALRRAAVTLNVHADVSVSHASNLRLFEATGVGTCLLTEARDNLTDWFVPGEEIVTWESPADCVLQIRRLLDDPARCEAIAAAGQARTLRDHTMRRRAERLLEHLGARLR